MPFSPTPSNPNPPGYELVKIDKIGFKNLWSKFKDRILDEFRWKEADILDFGRWLGQEDYAFKGRKWKEVFKSGAKIVGEDSRISTPLGPHQPAGGIDLQYIRNLIQKGQLKKPKVSADLGGLSIAESEN